ncbi:hypothetical protein BU26DRAFT_553690 [Trematosphaeria pertusa]|uniref:Uncharacterized protein n=1 Tax=Trematosphaeria pertusa TaxID=390896 RepID=A0A6A6I4H6_9PLEO|nr:uncharacterized protein BU26DRAFT_553690 [Trematosphaeria pertusa]KAF2245206.1 hypothetical protein BU26DRAFT_553690 [Trematosphaeria pertusa]
MILGNAEWEWRVQSGLCGVRVHDVNVFAGLVRNNVGAHCRLNSLPNAGALSAKIARAVRRSFRTAKQTCRSATSPASRILSQRSSTSLKPDPPAILTRIVNQNGKSSRADDISSRGPTSANASTSTHSPMTSTSRRTLDTSYGGSMPTVLYIRQINRRGLPNQAEYVLPLCAMGHQTIGHAYRLYKDAELIPERPPDFECHTCLLPGSTHCRLVADMADSLTHQCLRGHPQRTAPRRARPQRTRRPRMDTTTATNTTIDATTVPSLTIDKRHDSRQRRGESVVLAAQRAGLANAPHFLRTKLIKPRSEVPLHEGLYNWVTQRTTMSGRLNEAGHRSGNTDKALASSYSAAHSEEPQARTTQGQRHRPAHGKKGSQACLVESVERVARRGIWSVAHSARHGRPVMRRLLQARTGNRNCVAGFRPSVDLNGRQHYVLTGDITTWLDRTDAQYEFSLSDSAFRCQTIAELMRACRARG